MDKLLKESPRGKIILVTDENGCRYIKRIITENTESCFPVYSALKESPSRFVPRILSAEIKDGTLTVTEEYISGKPAPQVITDEKEMVRAARELCLALSDIHRLGIVHRDIKPSNLIISDNGQLFLLDFEASRMMKSTADTDTRYLGTEGFAPPEQYGFAQTDIRSDIYALGKTMECLFGSLSHEPKYRRIISKCTELDPSERFPDADAVMDALSEKNKKRAVGVSAAAFVLLLAAITAGAMLKHNDEPSDDVSDPTPKLSNYLLYTNTEKAEPVTDMKEPLLFRTADRTRMEYIIIDGKALKENQYVSMTCDYNDDDIEECFEITEFLDPTSDEKRSFHEGMIRISEEGHLTSRYFTDSPSFDRIFPEILDSDRLIPDDVLVQLTVCDYDYDGKKELILSAGTPDKKDQPSYDFIYTCIFTSINNELDFTELSSFNTYIRSRWAVFADADGKLTNISASGDIQDVNSYGEYLYSNYYDNIYDAYSYNDNDSYSAFDAYMDIIS